MAGLTIPSEMRALTLDGVGFDHLKVRRILTPRPGPNQLLARVDAAGICTSLIKLVEQGPAHSMLYGWDTTRYPLILGDEGSVTLVEVGEALQGRYHVGERYVVQPAVEHPPINHLDRYRNEGKGVQKLGAGYTLPGHLAEYILIPEEVLAADCLVALPDANLAYSHVAMSEPMSCVISAQDHHVHLSHEKPLGPRGLIKGLKPGGVTVVVGAGAMGRMHVELAMYYRPRAVICSDFIPERLDIVQRLFAPRAEKLGVTLHVVNAAKVDVKEVINQVTEYRGADDVIVAVGVAKAIETAQTYVGRGAVLNLFGGLKRGQDVVGFDTSMIHYQEINVTGSSGGSPWDIARTLELMATGEVDASNHITRVGDLEHAAEFLEMIKVQVLDGKAVVYPHRRTHEILSVPKWTANDERRYLGAD
jgi:threonine dehydrogenase-like Zn-dependent dehydrogenase